VAARHLELGADGERAAERHLKGLGYKVLDKNWRCQWGELDLVCARGDLIVFVEVKTRTGDGLTTPADGLTSDKRKRVASAARAYLSAKHFWQRPCRFDLILVVREDNRMEVEHVPNAFDATTTLGDRHTAWQPW
jgi:putative endonuclease